MTELKSAVGTFARSLYPLALVLLLFPFADITGRLLPFHVGNVQWRFGAIGLLFGGTLVMMLIGLALTCFVAIQRQDARVLLGAAYAATALAVLMSAALIMFALDGVQVRASLREELKASMLTATLSAAVGGILTIAGLVSLAVAAIRARRALRQATAVEAPLAIVGVR